MYNNRMSYQVLARKYRPTSFAALKGQDHISRALLNSLSNKKLHHAYLFSGTRGVGKTTIARILARCMNCEAGIRPEPCGDCNSCREISEGRSVDLIEVDAASRTGVDDMRELLENVQYMPVSGRFKVYLIDEVHMLSKSSFNAMLKTLEEPPEHIKFLFATTDPKKIPVTVLSRCIQLNLKSLPTSEIVDQLALVLKDESIRYEEKALRLLANAAKGSMRDGLSLADQAIAYGKDFVGEDFVRSMLGLVDPDLLVGLLEAIINDDGPQLFSFIESAASFSPDYSSLLAELVEFLHRIAVYQAVPSSFERSDTEEIETFSKMMVPENVQLLYQIGLIGQNDLPLAPNPRIGFEMVMLRMLSFAPSSFEVDAIPDLKSKLEVDDSAKSDESSEASPAENALRILKDGVKSIKKTDVEKEFQNKGNQTFRESPAAENHPPLDKVLRPSGWRAAVEAVGISGVTKTLALNCELRTIDEDNSVVLILDERHASLLSDEHVRKITLALTKFYSQDYKVLVELGKTLAETPAEEMESLKKAKKLKALEKIENDPTVKQAIKVFDGTLDPESVSPIED